MQSREIADYFLAPKSTVASHLTELHKINKVKYVRSGTKFFWSYVPDLPVIKPQIKTSYPNIRGYED